MRPVGAVVHMTKKTVNYSLVGWMVLGSVPAALLGAYTLHLLGNSKSAENNVQLILGAALLVGAAPWCCATGSTGARDTAATASSDEVVVRPLPTVAIGVIGGFVVGMTSVGSGSLMIVLLLFLYPVLGANQLVGTDLTQAVPLTLAAALGALAFGHVEFAVTDLHRARQRARRPGRLADLLAGAGPLHPPRHHVRDLRLGPQVRGARHHRAGLDARRRAPRLPARSGSPTFDRDVPGSAAASAGGRSGAGPGLDEARTHGASPVTTLGRGHHGRGSSPVRPAGRSSRDPGGPGARRRRSGVYALPGCMWWGVYATFGNRACRRTILFSPSTTNGFGRFRIDPDGEGPRGREGTRGGAGPGTGAGRRRGERPR